MSPKLRVTDTTCLTSGCSSAVTLASNITNIPDMSRGVSSVLAALRRWLTGMFLMLNVGGAKHSQHLLSRPPNVLKLDSAQ